MNKKIMIAVFVMFAGSGLLNSAVADFNAEAIEKLKPLSTDLPKDFVFGTVPGFAKNVLKENPWMMDAPAIKKMIPRIYPDGDYRNVSNVHMTIMTSKNKPYGYDICCYFILYKDKGAAKKEFDKLKSYSNYNSDRTIAITKDNMAVFLLVGNIDNYGYIRDMAGNIEEKMKAL